MNTVRREGPRTVIRQVPILLLLAGVVLSLPPLGYGLVTLVLGRDVDGKYFCLVFGAVLAWLFLEYVATRERIEVDRSSKTLVRTVAGLFRTTRQVIDYAPATHLGVEVVYVPSARGTGRREQLYLYAPVAKHLLNSPEKVYLDPAKLGALISAELEIPFHGGADA
jgi:hypothetical protein